MSKRKKEREKRCNVTDERKRGSDRSEREEVRASEMRKEKKRSRVQ